MSSMPRLAGFCAIGTVWVLAACSSNSAPGHPQTSPTSSGSSARPVSSAAARPIAAAFTDPSLVATITAAAEHDTEVINTYDYRSMTSSRDRALAASTGSLRNSLRLTYDRTLDPQAPAAKAVQTAAAKDAGITSINAVGNSAVALVWGTLTVTNASTNGPQFEPFGVVMTLQKVSGAWLAAADTADTESGPGRTLQAPGTAAVSNAETAATTEATAITTYRRASFDADFSKALAGATGSFRSDLESERTTTKQTMTSGHFDLVSTVGAVAVRSAGPAGVVVMVTLAARKVADNASDSSTRFQRLLLTMTPAGGHWLAANLEAVGVS